MGRPESLAPQPAEGSEARRAGWHVDPVDPDRIIHPDGRSLSVAAEREALLARRRQAEQPGRLSWRQRLAIVLVLVLPFAGLWAWSAPGQRVFREWSSDQHAKNACSAAIEAVESVQGNLVYGIVGSSLGEAGYDSKVAEAVAEARLSSVAAIREAADSEREEMAIYHWCIGGR